MVALHACWFACLMEIFIIAITTTTKRFSMARFDSDRDLAAEALRSGDLAAKQGAHPAAAGHYRDAIRLMPDFAEAYYKLGCALGTCGDFDEAIRSFDEYIILRPEDPNGYICLGRSRHSIGEQLAAIGEYSRAIAIKPDYARAFYLRGRAHSDVGAIEDAIRDYGDAIRFAQSDQNRYDALYRRADCLARLGRHEDAIADLKLFVQIMPDLVGGWLFLTMEYGRAGRTDEGLAAAEKAIQLAPENCTAHFFRGNRLVQHGDLDAAVDEYTKAVQLNANYAEAYCAVLVRTLRRAGLPRPKRITVARWISAFVYRKPGTDNRKGKQIGSKRMGSKRMGSGRR